MSAPCPDPFCDTTADAAHREVERYVHHASAPAADYGAVHALMSVAVSLGRIERSLDRIADALDQEEPT